MFLRFFLFLHVYIFLRLNIKKQKSTPKFSQYYQNNSIFVIEGFLYLKNLNIYSTVNNIFYFYLKITQKIIFISSEEEKKKRKPEISKIRVNLEMPLSNK